MKIKTIEVSGFEGALYGMRLPYESNAKSDSGWIDDTYIIGENDMKLCQRLIRAGSEHRKFLRMIHVQAEIIAPAYFIAELTTYKIGTTMNSSSLQHLGTKRAYTIQDFEIDDERVYKILDWQSTDYKSKHPLIFLEDGKDDFKIYKCGDREYKIFKNGRIVSCAYSVTDKVGNRTKHFDEKEVKFTQNPEGYYYCNLGGRRFKERWQVHRLVAFVWKPEGYSPDMNVDHIDNRKGNNHADNLQWISLSDNIKKGHEDGCFGKEELLHHNYQQFKKGIMNDIEMRKLIDNDYESGLTMSEIARKHKINFSTVWGYVSGQMKCQNYELFDYCLIWEHTLDKINQLRETYKETDDYDYFRRMRQMIPQSFRYHIMLDLNYENIYTIYNQRKNHRLKEWSGENGFCEWAETLPYFKDFFL